MTSSHFRNAPGSVIAGGLVASLLSALAVYLVGSSMYTERGSAILFHPHITYSGVILAAIFAVLWQSCGIMLGLYSTARESKTSSFVKAIECSVAMTLLLGICMDLTMQRPPLLKVLPVFLACALACELVGLSIGMLFQQRSSRVVIVGCNRLAVKAWREFRVNPDRHMQVVGFVNQPSSDEMMPDIASRCLGDLDTLPHIVLNQDIDDVIVATALGADSEILEQSVASAGSLGARILCLKDICGIHPESIARDYGDILFELVPAPRISGFEPTLKRIFDVTVSATVLLLSCLLLIPVAVLSLIEQRPITYRPWIELGFRRRKYRRWRLDSAPGGRRTKLLLEILPDMCNVLCGDMSLVGPTPLSEAQAAQADAATLAGRFNMRPGMIGNHHGSSVFAAQTTTRTDFSNWSLRMDLRALARAFRTSVERAAAIESQAGVQ